MSLEKFVEENPVMSDAWGLDEALKELCRLRRRVAKLEKLKEVLRTLLDDKATIAEFQAAVRDVLS